MAIQRFEIELMEMKQFTEHIRHYTFKVPDFSFEPGQYLTFMIPVGEGKFIRRPYSIASPPFQKGKIEFVIEQVPGGKGSPHLFSMKPGDKMQVIGPLGDFKLGSEDHDIVLVCTGTGIAPFRSMVRHLLRKGFKHKITLLAGDRYEDEVLYQEEFLALKEKHKNFEYQSVISQPKNPDFQGHTGHVQSLIEQYVPEFTGDFYLCGLKAMVFGVREWLVQKGVPMHKIYIEKYD